MLRQIKALRKICHAMNPRINHAIKYCISENDVGRIVSWVRSSCRTFNQNIPGHENVAFWAFPDERKKSPSSGNSPNRKLIEFI